MKKPAHLAVLLFLVVCTAHARQQVLDVTLSRDPGSREYLNGYVRTVSGAVLSYRSSHPDARSALLVRARKEVQRVSWESEPLRASEDGWYHLIWLAGLERQGFKDDPRSFAFDLLVNGVRWFTFQNRKDQTAWRWTESASNGSRLTFTASMADRVGDLFGMMGLDIPAGMVPTGKPLILEVAGADAGSEDWYMTFQYSFRFVPTVRIEPVLLRDPMHRRLARLSLDNLMDSASAEVRLPGGEAKRLTLGIGSNILRVPFQGSSDSGAILLVVRNRGVSDTTRVPVPPIIPRDIYLLPYSHNDIGYTDIQPEVERRHWKNIDDALELIHETKEYPAEARFKWNMEVLWAFDSYFRHASDSRRAEILSAVREGSLGLNALYGNMQTGIMSAPELQQSIAFAARFSDRYGISIRTALQSDVPGFVWGVVPTLAQQGIRYFASSPNPSDRIGYVLSTWGDRPFYWMSPSGRDSVLFWVAGLSYASFHEGSLPRLGEDKVVEILRKLDGEQYPYRIVNLPYTLGDNAGVDAALPKYVKEWNEKYESPRLVISTYENLFTEFERRNGSALARHRGDFTPYWEDGTISTAAETAVNRHAADRLRQAEVVWSMHPKVRFPSERFADAWRQVVLFDEHTWGAWNSISEPDDPGVRMQWNIKRQFALDADSLSRGLLSEALGLDKRRAVDAFDIVNTSSWSRSGLVLISASESKGRDRVTEADGTVLPSQRISTGELAVLVENVPPLGEKRILIRKGIPGSGGKAWTRGTSLGNEILNVEMDTGTGAIHRLEWAGRDRRVQILGESLNHFLYVSGTGSDSVASLRNVSIRVGESGGLLASLVITAEAPGCSSFEAEIRIVSGMPWIEVIDRLSKKAIRTKEAVHLAFPLTIPAGKVCYDVANAIVRPQTDQLAGSNKNFFSVQSWVDVSNDEYGVTLAVPDEPLIELGTMTAEQPWRTTVAAGTTVFSYLMNNYWHTNFKADQEGVMTARYRICFHEGFDGSAAVRFGRETREPLLVCRSAEVPADLNPFLGVQSSRTIVQSLRPLSAGGGWLVTLYNPSPLRDEVQVRSNSQDETRVKARGPVQREIMFPFETRAVLVRP